MSDTDFYRGRSDAFEKRAFEAEAEVERLRGNSPGKASSG